MMVEIRDDHEIDDNERFEIHLSHVGRSADKIGDLNKVGVTILENEG